MKIDWKLLREQKDYCINEAMNNKDAAHIYDGIVNMMDHLQDEAVANGTPEEEVFGDPFADQFMQPEVYFGYAYEVETTCGIELVPWDAVGDVKCVEDLQDYLDGGICGDQPLVKLAGFLARLSAAGYMDCTPWTIHDTEMEAMEYLGETYGGS